MSYRILIVDDSALTRAVVKRAIERAGVPVQTFKEAANGKEALTQLAAGPVDLVLADLHMPEMGGVEMTGQIRAEPSLAGMPIVVITAEPNLERIEELKKQGIAAVIRKPFTPEQIREVISSVLGVTHA